MLWLITVLAGSVAAGGPPGASILEGGIATGSATVPLYRGPVEAHRPMVRIAGPDDTERFAVIDLASGWTTVGRDQMARILPASR